MAVTSLAHTALDLTRLSPAAQKALAPGPQRMMAARGMVPLPRPGELVSVLYQIALDDAALGPSARSTAEGLPETIIAGALAEADLDPRVLDWLAPRCAAAPALLDALITAPAVADVTVVGLAARSDARTVDLIAHNEQRLLRCPDIIAAMYANPRARMSTVDRAVELAIRNQVKVDGIAAWDELVKVILSGGQDTTADDDTLFVQAVAATAEVDDSALTKGDADVPVGPDGELLEKVTQAINDKKVPISKMSISAKMRLATVGNAVARAMLVRDPLKMVAVSAIKSPGVTDIEAARHAGNPQLCDDVIRYIASRREWTRLYGVKLSLIMNPKTPISEVSRMLPHLREKDLKNVAKSKGIPSAVAAQATKLVKSRTPGAGK